MTTEYYAELETAHEKGKLVAWSNAMFPQEFLEAMDILVAYPENHAAEIAASHTA